MATLLSKGILRAESASQVQAFVPPIHDFKKPVPRPKAASKNVTAEEAERRKEEKTRKLYESQEVLRKAREEAEVILEMARTEAKEILEKAGKEARRIQEEAAREGAEAGYEDGLSRGEKQAAEELTKKRREQKEEFERELHNALSSVEEAKSRCIRNYMDELKDCSIAVAEKVIHISLSSSGDVIRRMILAETEKLKKTAWVKIYMAKTDYEMMAKADADLVSELSRLSDNIKFIVMEKENNGDCIIETPEEIIDISVDTQMENIKEIVQNVRF